MACTLGRTSHFKIVLWNMSCPSQGAGLRSYPSDGSARESGMILTSGATSVCVFGRSPCD